MYYYIVQLKNRSSHKHKHDSTKKKLKTKQKKNDSNLKILELQPISIYQLSVYSNNTPIFEPEQKHGEGGESSRNFNISRFQI